MLDYKRIEEIVNSEMKLATGCTEPVAVALASSVAKDQLEDEVESIDIFASGNIIKNAMSAGLPGTPYVGMNFAAAIGAVGGNSAGELNVIAGVTPEQYQKAEALVAQKKVAVSVAEVDEKVYIDARVRDVSGNTARAVIFGNHTNVICIEKNGKVVMEKDADSPVSGVTPEQIAAELSVAEIFEFIDAMDVATQTPNLILQAIEVNRNICEKGLEEASDYGLNIGKNIRDDVKKGMVSEDLISYVTMFTCAGVDARMAGAPIAVVSCAGSGNKGITCTMPVYAAAQYLQSDDDKMVRAVLMSCLLTSYIHSKFGRLSALCGATVAATGAGCGMIYLMGGGLQEIENEIHSMIGDVSGMICDGGKPDCALKVETCVASAIRIALLSMKGIRVPKTEGIVEQDVEHSIENYAKLGRLGSIELDKMILELMTNKRE